MCPKNEKTPKPAKTEEKQFPMETINVSRSMLLLNSLYEAIVIKPPKETPESKLGSCLDFDFYLMNRRFEWQQRPKLYHQPV